jgi:hypothetical protein
MTKIRLILAALIASGLALVGVAGGASASPLALTYKAVSYNETFKQVSPTSIHFTADQVQNYKVTSTLAVTCDYPNQSPTAVGHCVFTLRFTDGSGSLFGTAVVHANGRPAITIIGGTKGYLGATGTGTSIKIDPQGNISVLTLHYILP